ncbi:inositol monophosphatase family protein [Gracilibacillus marinus]|jgi:myo-inositol-1(or 4)-monophosphatase|uniref:Inositol-1-monophosphatase n=1 Tax=Gracilibacillus marinus TaxID=630535 RepID=A0ABV8VW52_9BACI
MNNLLVSNQELNLITDKVTDSIKKAGNMIRRGLAVHAYTYKHNQSDLVTEMDRNVEKYLVDALRQITPNYLFLTEETNPHQALEQEKMTWVMDPIDGTMNFVHGFERIAISVALCNGDTPIAAWVYDIHQESMYTAIKDKGAYCNGKLLSVSNEEKIESSLIAFGFSAQQWVGKNEVPLLMKGFAGKARGIRITGSSCLDLVDVAAGRIDGFWHFGLQPWDIAAGILLIEEAGGTCTTLHDEPILSSTCVLASNGKINASMKRILSSINRFI